MVKLCSSFHVVQHPPGPAPESSLFRPAADTDSGTGVGIIFNDYFVIATRIIGVLRTNRRTKMMRGTVNDADTITLTLSASALKCWVLSHWANVVSGTQPLQFYIQCWSLVDLTSPFTVAALSHTVTPKRTECPSQPPGRGKHSTRTIPTAITDRESRWNIQCNSFNQMRLESTCS